MYDAMLTAHGASGFLGLFAAVLSIATRLVALPHQWHVLAGRIFVAGMVGVGLTGLVITWVEWNPFLLSLAIFVLYLAVMGWRYARERKPMNGPLDKAVAVLSTIAFVTMILVGIYLVTRGQGAGIIMAVFGTIGVLHAIIDVRGAFGSGVTGKNRVAAHLSRMIGGTIAALTAFLLIQFQTSSIIVWLAPAAVLTPVISYWKYLIRKGGGLHRKAFPDRTH